MTRRRLRKPKHRREIDGDDGVPFGVGHLERALVFCDPGVVDQDVEATVFAHRGVDRGQTGRAAHIGGDVAHALWETIGQVRLGQWPKVTQQQTSALLVKPCGRGQADAAGGSGDDGDLVRWRGHGLNREPDRPAPQRELYTLFKSGLRSLDRFQGRIEGSGLAVESDPAKKTRRTLK